MVLQPNFWASADASDQFNFIESLIISDEVINIDGDYTSDLDLIYTSNDVISLFNYFYKDYEEICYIALESFKIGEDND